jgi:hypothetical protein
MSVQVGGLVLEQTLVIGRLLGSDLLLGCDWLFRSEVEHNFAKQTLPIHHPTPALNQRIHMRACM